MAEKSPYFPTFLRFARRPFRLSQQVGFLMSTSADGGNMPDAGRIVNPFASMNFGQFASIGGRDP